jgi:hypothetical protein
MVKFFQRFWDACRRLAQALSLVRTVVKVILGALAALGAGVVYSNWQALKPWLLSDWTHIAVSVLAAAAVLAFIALFGAVWELGEMRHVQIRVSESGAQIFPLVRSNDGVEHRDVLCVGVSIVFRNDSDRPTRAFFPKIDLVKRSRWWRWKPLPVITLYLPLARTVLRGVNNRWLFWHKNARHEIPARDELTAGFSVYWKVAKPGGGIFLGSRLRLRVAVDVIGQPLSSLEVSLPELIEPPPGPPLTGLPSSKASA